MTYRDISLFTNVMICESCWTVVQQCDQERHDQTVHSDKVTIYNGAGDIGATYPDDWREPIVADKNTCYHPEET